MARPPRNARIGGTPPEAARAENTVSAGGVREMSVSERALSELHASIESLSCAMDSLENLTRAAQCPQDDKPCDMAENPCPPCSSLTRCINDATYKVQALQRRMGRLMGVLEV